MCNRVEIKCLSLHKQNCNVRYVNGIMWRKSKSNTVLKVQKTKQSIYSVPYEGKYY